MATHSILNQETDLIQKRPLKEDIFDVLHEKIISKKKTVANDILKFILFIKNIYSCDGISEFQIHVKSYVTIGWFWQPPAIITIRIHKRNFSP